MEIDDLKPGTRVVCIRTYDSYVTKGDICTVQDVDKYGQEGGEITVDRTCWVWDGSDRFDSIFALIDFKTYTERL